MEQPLCCMQQHDSGQHRLLQTNTSPQVSSCSLADGRLRLGQRCGRHSWIDLSMIWKCCMCPICMSHMAHCSDIVSQISVFPKLMYMSSAQQPTNGLYSIAVHWCTMWSGT